MPAYSHWDFAPAERRGTLRKAGLMQVGRNALLLFWAMFALDCGIINLASANHPFHVSTAEVEFNAKTKRLEVGLKCQSTDLERALRLMAGGKIDIENDPQVDELVTRYVTDNFYLAVAPAVAKAESLNKASDKSLSREVVLLVPDAPKEPIKLIGKEFETKWIWIYFELQPPPGDDPLVLVNRILFEVNAGQINTCLIRQDGQRHALKSTASKPLQDFDRKWLVGSATKGHTPQE